MHVISAKALRGFYQRYPAARTSLTAWLKLMEADHSRNLVELKQTFATVDYLSVNTRDLYIFDLGGNKYRVVTAIHYNSQTVFIRHVLTHAEYDTDRWKANP